MSIDSASLRNAFGLWTASQLLGGVFFCSLLSVSSGRVCLGIPRGKTASPTLDRYLKQKEDPVPEGVGVGWVGRGLSEPGLFFFMKS